MIILLRSRVISKHSLIPQCDYWRCTQSSLLPKATHYGEPMYSKNIPSLCGILYISKMYARLPFTKLCIPTLVFVSQSRFRRMCVGTFPAGGGWMRPLDSRLSFHPLIYQQPQRNGPLPGFKSNNNQSAIFYHTKTYSILLSVDLLCLRDSFWGTLISLKCSLVFFFFFLHFESISPNSAKKKNLTFSTKKIM